MAILARGSRVTVYAKPLERKEEIGKAVLVAKLSEEKLIIDHKRQTLETWTCTLDDGDGESEVSILSCETPDEVKNQRGLVVSIYGNKEFGN